MRRDATWQPKSTASCPGSHSVTLRVDNLSPAPPSCPSCRTRHQQPATTSGIDTYPFSQHKAQRFRPAPAVNIIPHPLPRTLWFWMLKSTSASLRTRKQSTAPSSAANIAAVSPCTDRVTYHSLWVRPTHLVVLGTKVDPKFAQRPQEASVTHGRSRDGSVVALLPILYTNRPCFHPRRRFLHRALRQHPSTVSETPRPLCMHNVSQQCTPAANSD